MVRNELFNCLVYLSFRTRNGCRVGASASAVCCLGGCLRRRATNTSYKYGLQIRARIPFHNLKHRQGHRLITMDAIADGEIFRLIVTQRYVSVSYDGTDLVFTPGHHLHGDLFSISEDGKLIHGPDETEVGILVPDSDYPDDLFYFSRNSKYLCEGGVWAPSADGALQLQVNSMDEYDRENPPPIRTEISNPVIDAQNPVSADGIDLYHPDAWFTMYFTDCSCREYGSVEESSAPEFPPELVLTGSPYGAGFPFRLSTQDGKVRIQDPNDRFLGLILKPSLAEYRSDECKGHDAFTGCSSCYYCYAVGFVSEPEHPITIIPHGLPTTFALYDGKYYYSVNIIKSSYSELQRVGSIDNASLVQFVGR
ncbi:hypothetical protein BDV26DRAFT_271049 [Aspergillus bertholletiae]|uniref:Uncharacterized protein n=1 Tax=Aspergillus bertholletiae TaxID=1226010 RepID=A0A5N7AVK9_9EURO|nr:hypothetical protein BDV26DRAFT_271049 [Aspergillus bertholletiae]